MREYLALQLSGREFSQMPLERQQLLLTGDHRRAESLLSGKFARYVGPGIVEPMLMYRFQNRRDAVTALSTTPSIVYDPKTNIIDGPFTFGLVLAKGGEESTGPWDVLVGGDELKGHIWSGAKTAFEQFGGRLIKEFPPHHFPSRSTSSETEPEPNVKDVIARLAVAPTGPGENLPPLPQGWTCLESAHFLLLGAAFQEPPESDLMLSTAKIAAITGADLSHVNERSRLILNYSQQIVANDPRLLLVAYLHHCNEVFVAAGSDWFRERFVPGVEELAKEVGNVPSVNGFAVKGCKTMMTLIGKRAGRLG
jgi:hypothetical protein